MLVYSHKITPRVSYGFKHIFKRVLRMPLELTSDEKYFLTYNGLKMSYTKKPLGNEFFVRNTSLLFEQGIRDIEFKVHDWEGIPCFFTTGETSDLPYDIFAAAFFLVTRYEEYYPQVHDQYDRYLATNSTAVQYDFLERPVVDIWAYKLLRILKEKFPDYPFPVRNYHNVSTINVNEVYAYKNLGLFRHTVGIFKDVYSLKFDKIIRRFSVIFGLKKDPHDKYQEIIELAKANNKKLIFFFLFSEYNTYDKNVSFSNYSFKMLIKSLIDYTPFGILFSYFTLNNPKKVTKEKNRLEAVVNRPVVKSRQHFNRLEIPRTYQMLIENDITEEYTMGYHTHLGFRAGTCTHFYFYDLEYEIQTPLKVLPFCVMDELMKNKMGLSTDEAKAKIKKLQEEVKVVNGLFISIFHTSTMSDVNDGEDWSGVYKAMIEN